MKHKYKIENIVLIILYMLIGIAKWIPSIQDISMIVIIVGIFYFSLKDSLYKLAPMFIFFNSSILYFSGIAICDIFFACYLLCFLKKKIYLKKKHLHPMFLVFIIYTMLVISKYNLSLAVEVLLSLLFCYFFLNDLMAKDKWRQFCNWYIVGIFSATIYGIKNYMDALAGVAFEGESVRYTLSFMDPNYAGLFLSIGLYMLILLKDNFRLMEKIVGVTICIVSILLTISSSAILCNAIVALFLIFSNGFKNINIKVIFKYAIIIVTFMIILFGITKNYFPDAMRSFERFEQKVELLKSGELGSATTERSDIWKKHLQFFGNQKSPIKILIGGNYLTDRGFDAKHFSIVSHEVYIDSLVCFGLLGTLIYVVTVIHQFFYKWKYRNLSEDKKVIFAIILIWLIYSFILSMFPFWAFIFFMFLDVEEEIGYENKKLNT